MQLLLCFFRSLLIPLPSRDLLVAMLPLLLNIHSFLFYKWIFSKLVTLFLLHAVDNLSLPFVMHKYGWLCFLCGWYYYWCSPWWYFMLLWHPLYEKTDMFIGSGGIELIPPWVLLGPMTCPMDPIELYSHVVILHRTMCVYELKLQMSKGYFFIVQPNLQWKSGPCSFFFRCNLADSPSRSGMSVLAWWACPWKTSTKHAEYSLC